MRQLVVPDLEPVQINGHEYYTVKQFAWLTNRSEQSVRHLMHNGNRVRKLKVKRIAGKPFILKEELTQFPFTTAGPVLAVFHYDEDGRVVDDADQAEVADAQ